jgi:glycosyltransferase involved in cell wall biosynthesis
MKSVCLISPDHISYNPRLVKEADALSAAGFHVRVVAMNHTEAHHRLDEEIMKNRSWEWETVCARRDTAAGKLLWLKAGLRCKIISLLGLDRKTTWGLLRLYSKYHPELTRRVSSKRADLFKAHLLRALPAAVMAARRWNTKVGFDAEDFHRGEFQATSKPTGSISQTKLVEERFIPLCHHLTAASHGIAEAYAASLNIPVPPVVLNTFPFADRLGNASVECLRQERGGFRISLYWFSAIIGMDRGLQDALAALRELPADVGLSIRGTFAPGAQVQLESEIVRGGLGKRVRFLAPAPPEQLVELAAQHDIGLALEPGNRLNNRIATSNKLLVYFVAGIAVAASDVPGQATILAHEDLAAFLYPPGDTKALVAGLSRWTRDPLALAEAKRKSLKLGKEQFCWELESQKLVAAVQSALSPTAAASQRESQN